MRHAFDTRIFDNRPDTLGIDWGPIIGAGINYGTQFLPQPNQHGGGACHAPAGCFQCPMTGQGDIAGCIDQLLAQLYPMLVGGVNPNLGGNIPNGQAYQAFQNGLAALNNPAFFAQGSDAYLRQAKAALTAAITRYQAANPNAGTGGTTQQVVTDPATGQQIVVTVPAAGGIDNTTLLLLGGAAVFAFLLMKN